jgi:hypothetical protein
MEAVSMTGTTTQWWAFLCTVSALNVAAWLGSAVALRRRHRTEPGTWAAMRWQCLLSAGYVLGCAYRSVFPVFDVKRWVLVDSFLSSVLVGRSVATVAELCFAAQWALLAHALGRSTGSAVALQAARLVLPLIAVAEAFSWYAVLTTVNLGHVVEESLWGLCVLWLVVAMVSAWPRCPPDARPVLALASVAGLAYVAYMFHVDVPMYWARWLHDAAQGHAPLGIVQGFVDVSSRWVVTHRWQDWASEAVWMSLYFSVAVWLSIGMIHVPARWGATHRLRAAGVPA